MKKIFLTMMAAALLVVGLTACGGKDKYPFKDLADLYSDLYLLSQNDPDAFNDMDKVKSYESKVESLCKELYGKSIEAVAEEGLGIELKSNEAEIGEGYTHGDNIHIPMNFDLKITDADLALINLNDLMAVLYDDEDKPVYVTTYIKEALSLEKEVVRPVDTDSIVEIIDSVIAVEADGMPEEKVNPYKNGQVLNKGIDVGLESLEILLLAKATKLVIEKWDVQKSSGIRDSIRERLKTTIRELEEKASAKKTESGADGQKDEEASAANDVTPNAEPGRGDLGAYDLRGPVKKVIYDGWNCTFNEQGQLLTIDGQNLKTIYPGGITRDKNGRLKDCNADGYGSCSYNYNSKGLPTEIYADGCGRVLTYDADGYLKTETCSYPPEMGDEEGEEEIVKYTYTILEKDSYGNWTKRKDQNGAITTRKITYF